MDDLTDRDIAGFKARLEAMRAELTSLLDAAASSSATVVLDQSSVGRLSRMDALQSQAMALETERRRAQEIRRIDAALKRIEDGEYGYCIVSGEPIPRARLDLDPAAATTVDHAR
jgi:DnaK suppressor protein